MTFTLKYKDINEERELKDENYTIKDLLDELELPSETIIPKQNSKTTTDESVICEGDEIELIKVIYGG